MPLSGVRSLVRGCLAKKQMYNFICCYGKRFETFAFKDLRCESFEQFQASITRLYHMVEKGLAHEDAEYRAGFGSANVDCLIASLEQYVNGAGDTSAFFYQTALSCLNEYIDRNRAHGHEDSALEFRVSRLPGKSNGEGGAIRVVAPANPGEMCYESLVKSRHSIRNFSGDHVEIALIEESLDIAQYAPSACNRQGWRTYIVVDRTKIRRILDNQNGNRGFGDGIDKLLVITADLRAQQSEREYFEAFIEGGMYARGVIDALHSRGIASIPLSASLTATQEKNVRKAVGMDEAEVLILFLGVGDYPDGGTLTTKSVRRPAVIKVV